MESIREIYKIGYGPSSSHTMGPRFASEEFKSHYPMADKYSVTLYGSLAATGKGHLTDVAIMEALAPSSVEMVWKPEIFLEKHPNGIKFEAYSEGAIIGTWTTYSVGGGKISDLSTEQEEKNHIYPLRTMSEVLRWSQKTGKQFWEYVVEHEGEDIFDHLNDVWKVMKEAVKRGIEEEGTLPGGLHIGRKASSYYTKSTGYRTSVKHRGFLMAYALAVAEENACGGKVVTAPTCGSCGVVPGVLYLLKNSMDIGERKILRALATAGLVGNFIKHNASISGAEVGCQGEIGTACAMASAGATYAFGGTSAQIEYAASIGIEHFLGLTCDPIKGLVQVPCIERNAIAAAKALDSQLYAMLSDGTHFVPFDKVVRVMKQTGKDLPSIYKETSAGGLAIFANGDETN